MFPIVLFFTKQISILLASCKGTGKSLSEALIFASNNPQYDDRLFIELQVQYMKTCSPHVQQKRRTSDKDLPVQSTNITLPFGVEYRG